MKRVVTFTLMLICLLLVSNVQAAITTTGNVLPADPGSWTAATLGYIGQTANGSLTINGGDDVVAASLYVAQNANVDGSVILSGTASDPSSSTLTVSGGTHSILGWNDGCDGSISVSGNAELTVNVASVLWGWNAGSNASLSVTDGGTASISGSSHLHFGRTGSCDVQVGNPGGTATSTLNLSSLGSHLDLARLDNGAGCTFEIWENGVVDSSTIEGNIAYGVNAPASMLVSGGTWLSGSTVVARRAVGSMLVEKGGLVDSGNGIIAEFETATGGYATISGAGSLWDCEEELVVGMDSLGVLNIFSGGEVKAGTLVIDYDLIDPEPPEGLTPLADSLVMVGNLGMLTLDGEYADMTAFLGAILGSDRVKIWDQTATWVDAAAATPGVDYTLTYDPVEGATTLTALAVVPEPSTLILLLGLALVGWVLRKK